MNRRSGDTRTSGAVELSDEVAAALATGVPVVALESTIVAHGMPWPQNVETARAAEGDIRAAGAVPATIAVIEGRPKAGLTRDELTLLARGGGNVAKVSRRDLPIVVARGATGATTVAATMIVAALAGIRVFATGGIGGVHRGAAESDDVSSDLTALARWPVAVVCAGAKAILDLPRTVERLETLGVPVYGWGTGELPAFYRRSSGLPVDARFDAIEDLAAAARAHWALGFAGIVVGNPIPAADELPQAMVRTTIDRALAEAAERGIRGRELTPFLLERMRDGTAGRSLAANLALLRSNARVGAALAAALAASA
jgi:pseudouridine-5'-phosphate glycosidase